jgi:hypothetical protein
MTRRAKIHLIGVPLMPILILASTGSKCANAPAKLDAYYTATLLGVPIGHISWVVDLKENHFSSVATGSIAGLLRLFLDAQGSVAAEGRLSRGKPVPSKFQLKLLAGKWSDEVDIVFSGNRAKESVLSTSANPSADYVPIKDGDRVGASDPMTALLIYVGGTGITTVPQACERTVAIFDGHTRYNLRLAYVLARLIPLKAIRDQSWCVLPSSSRLPDTTLSIFWSLISRPNTKPKSGSRLLAAPGSLSHTGPPFQRPWGLAFWRQQNLCLFLSREIRAKAIESIRAGASEHFDHSPLVFLFWTILLRGRIP